MIRLLEILHSSPCIGPGVMPALVMRDSVYRQINERTVWSSVVQTRADAMIVSLYTFAVIARRIAG